MENKEKKVQQINIELDEKVSSGEYANFVVVTHSPAEFDPCFDSNFLIFSLRAPRNALAC
jgi:ABC-type molybdenum transport system ATPase subunit/photorepair protein PhrA